MIPGNPYAELAEFAADKVPSGWEPASDAAVAQAYATLALAYEQHQRNRLAALTAQKRGLDLPPDLEDLATEGAPE